MIQQRVHPLSRSLAGAVLFAGLMAATIGPAFSASRRIELLASTQISSSSNSQSFQLSTAVFMSVGVDITAVSGTTPQLDLWLECSDDGGTTYYEVPAARVLKSTRSASAAPVAAANSVTINARDIVDAYTTAAAARFWADYPELPSDYCRLAWTVSGTTPLFTLSVSAVTK